MDMTTKVSMRQREHVKKQDTSKIVPAADP
jgi:hypothetical protein